MSELKKRTLVDIAADLDRVFDKTFETEGEITAEIEAELEAVQGELAAKLDGIAYLCKVVLPADVDKLKQLEQAAKAKQQVLENKRRRILDYAGQFVELMPDGMKGSPYKIYKGKSEAVEIESLSDVPKEFIKTVITETPDKTAIKDAIKGGAAIPGASLVKREDWRVR